VESGLCGDHQRGFRKLATGTERHQRQQQRRRPAFSPLPPLLRRLLCSDAKLSDLPSLGAAALTVLVAGRAAAAAAGSVAPPGSQCCASCCWPGSALVAMDCLCAAAKCSTERLLAACSTRRKHAPPSSDSCKGHERALRCSSGGSSQPAKQPARPGRWPESKQARAGSRGLQQLTPWPCEDSEQIPRNALQPPPLPSHTPCPRPPAHPTCS
jgi:hypothetical protein